MSDSRNPMRTISAAHSGVAFSLPLNNPLPGAAGPPAGVRGLEPGGAPPSTRQTFR
eukprot:CAMPEP_0171766630 /NCGR_PEP_ID=MMETSP0991-20121206/51352_1 /TAXON_ID=483369 /ORGANISM="non described non described, Strain CCMP2098" /LENGTH=55 /DNA_ID=CAMNT_0012371293 /DNA_START=256 /DNA_END=423 /DNA_ORIENTATION=-